jgi:spermidine synthase
VAVQCTSPLLARKSYWCIVRTMEAAGLHVAPYHAAVPSFGVWGFTLAKQRPFDTPSHVTVPVRFLDDATLASMFVMPPDMAPVEVEINRLDNQMLVRYYENEWRPWS